MPHSISTSESDFDQWLEGLVGFLLGIAETPVYKSAEKETLAEAVKDWAKQYKACIEAQAAAAAARAAKDLTRGLIEEIARRYCERAEGAARAGQAALAPPIAVSGCEVRPCEVIARPVLRLMDVSTPLVVGLYFVEVEERNAMPPGIQFCEVRCQVGGQCPSNPESLSRLALETRPPYRVDFAACDAGQTAWLAFRWVRDDGEAGLWSEIYSLAVPG